MGETQVGSESIGSSERYHTECGVGTDDALNNVMDGAVAAAGEDGVDAVCDGFSGLFSGGTGSARGDRLGVYTGGAQDIARGVDLVHAMTPGERIIEENGVAHGESN